MGTVQAARPAQTLYVTIRAYAGEPLPEFGAHDALVVFGGEQNARDDEKHPYLPALASLMRRFGDSDKAVLGICLGSQLLARAYGGTMMLFSSDLNGLGVMLDLPALKMSNL